MKCTIESIRNIELKDKRFGSRLEAFAPFETEFIFDTIKDWIKEYAGVHAVIYDDGIRITAWAEAKCSERDTYNPITGAHIAESKAKAKMYRFLRNFSELMANSYASISDYMQDAYLKYDHCVDHEEEHTEYLSNAIEE